MRFVCGDTNRPRTFVVALRSIAAAEKSELVPVV
jgi:hypothetical protein